jgi:5-azacytidine-induced protein 1
MTLFFETKKSARLSRINCRRIRDKYETELKEVEKTERETTERYNILKARYNELESNFERNKVVLKQKDKELEDIHKVSGLKEDERSYLFHQLTPI